MYKSGLHRSQIPYLKGDSQCLIFARRGELKGVYVSGIIGVRHLQIKILCQPINIYECVKFPTSPFHNFHASQVEGGLTLERCRVSLPARFSLFSVTFLSSLQLIFQLTLGHSPFLFRCSRSTQRIVNLCLQQIPQDRGCEGRTRGSPRSNQLPKLKKC